MASSIPRPIPTGVNVRGLPVWDGANTRRFREAHGVTQGYVARAMAITTGEAGSVYEQERVRLAIPYDRMERYFQAIERMAAQRDALAAKSLAELRATVVRKSK